MKTKVITTKLAAAVLAAAMLVSLTTSCEKRISPESEKLINQTLKSIQVSDYSLDNIPIQEYKYNLELLLTNPFDKDDEKIKNYLYQLSLATRELIKDANFNKIVIEMAKKSENQTANLLELEIVAPEYYEAINSKLSGKGYSLKKIASDLTHKPSHPDPKCPEQAKIEQYVPAIFIPNLDMVNDAKQPIISPNLVVDSRNDKSIEDNVIAWYYTEDGDLKEIILSEETSSKTSNPLFFLDNASLKVKRNPVPILPSNGNLKAIATTTSFHSCEYKINFHFESWWAGASEFCIVAYRINPAGEVSWIYDAYGWKEIAQVSRSDIGVMLEQWSLHAGNYTPYDQNYVFWNTFERDWNFSPKSLGSATANGLTIYLVGNMAYEDEWYAWDPTTLQSHNTDFDYIYSNWAIWCTSTKSEYRIWRVEL
ncbi:MAG: hypothetical protein D4R64_14700 [Porphyromonadaceae bacterium]|nr:MAG: hypothetical protein D4R64_14700 [Porphyromonadaceae bacterium]